MLFSQFNWVLIFSIKLVKGLRQFKASKWQFSTGVTSFDQVKCQSFFGEGEASSFQQMFRTQYSNCCLLNFPCVWSLALLYQIF